MTRVGSRGDIDSVTWGEFLATQAEWARAVGRDTDALARIVEAKATLGSSLVFSWFTVRFAEISMRAASDQDLEPLLHEIERRVGQLPDIQLATAIRVHLLRWTVNVGRTADAQRLLADLATYFPPIEGC